jgi:hypothetical protein
MDLIEKIKDFAPFLATALGGPAAGAATKILTESIFGKEESEGKGLNDIVYDESMKAKVLLADMELQKQVAILTFKKEELMQKDSASAREMQAETKSIMPAILSSFLAVSFICIIFYSLEHGIKDSNEIILILLGSLSTSFAQVIQFYFGSSLGSSEKNNIFKNIKK